MTPNPTPASTRHNAAAIRWLILTLTLGLIALAIVALACGPASSTSPNGDAAAATEQDTPQETPTPTPTPEMIYLEGPDGTPVLVPAPPTPLPYDPVLSDVLQRKADEYEATKEARAGGVSGAASPDETEYIYIYVVTDTADRVDEVAEFLNKNGAINVETAKGNANTIYAGSVGAWVLPEILEELADLEGVIKVDEPDKPSPAGNNRQAGPPVSPLITHGVQSWHLAGTKGKGVAVGIIDTGFSDFSTRIAPLLTTPVKFLCFGSMSPTRTNLNICEPTAADYDDHGTKVAKTLLEIAPEVTLYISNPRNTSELKKAVDWMTADTNDDNNDADNHNVKIINHSAVYRWDGRGDGTSPFNMPMDYSALNSVDDAVRNGTVWVNAAGNRGQRTWFSRSIKLSGGYIDFDDTTTVERCNSVSLVKGKTYNFQLRWADRWPRANINLGLYLYGPYASGIRAVRAAYSNDSQRGGSNQYPREHIDAYTATHTADYCLYVLKSTSSSVPAWAQLQTETIPGPNLDIVVNDGQGSIDNPAESANRGMLAVGATTDVSTPTIRDFSGRGPAPEPRPSGRSKPEVVGVNTASLLGTSFAAPRVAGMAALIHQRLGSSASYDQPHEIVAYIKRHAKQLGAPDPNNQWGQGLARLPQPPPPLSLTLRRASGDADGLALSIRFSRWDASDKQRYQVVLERLVNGVPQTYRTDLDVMTSTLTYGALATGSAYRAKARRCADGTSAGCGEWSALSSQVLIPNPSLPAPAGLTGTAGNGRITLDWDDVANVTGYEVQQWRGSTTSASASRATITGLTNGTRYYHRVRSVNGARRSTWTRWVSTTPAAPVTPPSAPSGLSGRGGHGSVTLDWSDVAGATGYQVQQWDGRAGQMRTLPFRERHLNHDYTVTFSGSSATVSGLASGAGYRHRVRSFDGSLYSSWTGSVSTTTLRAPQSLTKPTNLSGAGASRTVNLTWKAVPGATGYEVQQWDGRAGYSRILPFRESHLTYDYTIGFNGASAAVGRLSNGVTYAHRVRAVSANVRSPWSSWVATRAGSSGSRSPGSVSDSAPAPTSEPEVNATPTPVAGQKVASEPTEIVPTALTAEAFQGQVILSWESGADSSHVEQVVRRRKAGAGTDQWTEFSVDADAVAYTDVRVESSATYVYHIRTWQTDGTLSESKPATVTIP